MTTLPANLDSLRRIVAEFQAYKLRWPASDRLPKAVVMLVDGLTASAALAVYDATPRKEQPRMAQLIADGPDRLARLAALAWRK